MISGSTPTWPMAGATANAATPRSARRAGEPIHRKPHQPHYQSRDYNPLNGGIARWFDPVLPEIGCRCQHDDDPRDLPCAVRAAAADARLARRGASVPHRGAQRRGRAPTPEGMHRDGVDYVLVLLIGRATSQSGVTSIRGTRRPRPRQLHPDRAVDAAWVDDHRVMHGVTPVQPIDPSDPASATCWW